jgi:aromatic-L-amino-acid/L-tryptophan decarboxylase
MMDWLGKMLKLPEFYLASTGGLGGGVIQGTASEATLVTLLAARNKAIQEAKDKNPDMPDHIIRSKLVMYCSQEVNLSSSVFLFNDSIEFNFNFKIGPFFG